ncbi:MAG TPA: oxaloacetate decarboxylase [Candidatus Binatia bacterium]|nr:oxaloacetate decarboxylase [Candidatus Binatia bacterium]
MRRTTQFRQLIEADEILMLPGVQDALSARLAEAAGFSALACGGYAATASLLGAPDTAQLSMTEMADLYARLSEATTLPILADADTGYGNAVNVVRTVKAFERAGVAALFIEDQVAPKRCGHMEGKRVIPVADMVAKLKAALDARRDGDLVIMARTDARATEGLEAAIERAQIYREAGADVIFVEAPLTIDEMSRICSEIPAPCMANSVEGGKTPLLSAEALQQIGYAAVAFPVAATYVIAHALARFYAVLKSTGETTSLQKDMSSFAAFHDIVGLPALREFERGCDAFARDLLERVAGRGRETPE